MAIQSLSMLRPLRLGELLDRAIRLYRANFLTFIGIIAPVYVPLSLLQTAVSTLVSSSIRHRVSLPGLDFSRYLPWLGGLFAVLLWVLEMILLHGLARGALTRAVAGSYVGRNTGIGEAYRGIRSAWLTLIGALFLLGLAAVAFTVWGLVPCIGWFTSLGMTLFVFLAIDPLLAPVVVLENHGVFDALRRAWNLARRRFWSLLGYVFVLYLFSSIVVNGPATVAATILLGVFRSFGNTAAQDVLAAAIGGLLQLVSGLVYLPLQFTAFTLIYFDLRIRTEGFDLVMLTQTDLSAAPAVPVPQVSERWVTGSDLGNFAILTLAGSGLLIFLLSFFMSFSLYFGSLFIR